MGENEESQPQNVGFDDFYGFLSVSDMYTEWRDPYFFPEVVYSEERTRWIENQPFNKCFVHATKGERARERRGGHDPGALRCSTTSGPTYSIEFIRRMAGEDQPWFLYHCTRGAHFDNYPHERFLGSSPAKHPYKDTIIELDDIVGRLVAELEATGQLEDTLVFVSSDNGPEMETWPDAAYSPFRCAKGSTWEGGQRVPGIVVVAGDDRRRSRVGRPVLAHGLVPDHARGSPAPRTRSRTTATSTASTRRRSCSRGDGDSNRKYLYYWLGSTFSALRVGEYKFMLGVDLRRRPRRDEPRRVHRRHAEVHVRPALQPVPRSRRRRAAT